MAADDLKEVGDVVQEDVVGGTEQKSGGENACRRDNLCTPMHAPSQYHPLTQSHSLASLGRHPP